VILTDCILLEVKAELERARALHPRRFNSAHEGYAVLLEEVDELWDEIKANPQDRRRMRAEAIQVAAMAMRFLVEVCS